MKETDEERAARQAKLQKALSAAYLSHQIDELETKVQKAHLGSSSAAKGPVVVLDASALLFAPKRVRDAVKAGRTVVVPLEVFHTLDLLKKGSSPLATAARAATRYIEHATRQGPGSNASQGLRMQRFNESKEVKIVTNDTKPPKWVLSVLSCVHHFAPHSSFWMAKSTAGPGKAGLEVDEAELRYGERGQGDVVRFWAGACSIEVVSVEDPLSDEKREGKKVQERFQVQSVRSQPPKLEAKTPAAVPSPMKRATPVLLKREPKVEEIPPPRPTTAPTILQRPPAKVRAIGRYLDNDDDDDEPPPKPSRSSQAKSQKSNTPRGGFTLLQRDTNPPRSQSETSENSAVKEKPKMVLLQRPRG